MTELFLIVVSAILVNNFVLARFLGLCPFIGVSNRLETATGMSLAVLFVMTLAGLVTWTVSALVLEPFGLEYLQTVCFILVIASLVQLVELFIQKASPPLYRSLGIYLPLITTNCAILGVAVLNIQKNHTLLQTLVFSAGAALGFGLALILLASIRNRLEFARVPSSLKGAAISFITIGILSLAFMGFSGLVRM